MSVWRNLKEIRFHPYKLQLVQELQNDDFRTRLAFSSFMLERLRADPGLAGNLFFSDEAHFSLHGSVNRHNFRYWAPNNPQWVGEIPLHSPKVTVWLGIGVSGIVGPFFWEPDPLFPKEKGITSRWYKAMLENQAIPALQQFENHGETIFMLDGAPPHYGKKVRELLETTFPNRWIGRGGPIGWPARSPDLTWLDFFVGVF